MKTIIIVFLFILSICLAFWQEWQEVKDYELIRYKKAGRSRKRRRH